MHAIDISVSDFENYKNYSKCNINIIDMTNIISLIHHDIMSLGSVVPIHVGLYVTDNLYLNDEHVTTNKNRKCSINNFNDDDISFIIKEAIGCCSKEYNKETLLFMAYSVPSLYGGVEINKVGIKIMTNSKYVDAKLN